VPGVKMHWLMNDGNESGFWKKYIRNVCGKQKRFRESIFPKNCWRLHCYQFIGIKGEYPICKINKTGTKMGLETKKNGWLKRVFTLSQHLKANGTVLIKSASICLKKLRAVGYRKRSA